MTALANFLSELRAASDLVDVVAKSSVEIVSEIAEKELVDSTPVDTGRAREAWQTETISPTRREIVNDVPYIHALQHGSSAQAPDGILNPALDRAEKKAAKALETVARSVGLDLGVWCSRLLPEPRA